MVTSAVVIAAAGMAQTTLRSDLKWDLIHWGPFVCQSEANMIDSMQRGYSQTMPISFPSYSSLLDNSWRLASSGISMRRYFSSPSVILSNT